MPTRKQPEEQPQKKGRKKRRQTPEPVTVPEEHIIFSQFMEGSPEKRGSWEVSLEPGRVGSQV